MFVRILSKNLRELNFHWIFTTDLKELQTEYKCDKVCNVWSIVSVINIPVLSTNGTERDAWNKIDGIGIINHLLQARHARADTVNIKSRADNGMQMDVSQHNTDMFHLVWINFPDRSNAHSARGKKRNSPRFRHIPQPRWTSRAAR